ncbi:acetyl-CoA carboxylase biotin carboxylase subunit family protein [Streptomyces sp. NPDC101166]|uniref:ATP-grasp domain-containing protein n=1 Tax=Streptomyces sp. NPDC101166 TaxID=3366120 RepID=UPI0038119971
MADSDVRLPHLLLIVGIGGPSPKLLAPGLAGIARVSWLFDSRDLTKPERDVPIMAEAGQAIAVSSQEGMVAAAAALHGECRVDGVLTFSENALRAGAAVAEKLGLPFNSPATARRLTDKYLQREALAAAGVPCPRFHPVRTADDLTPAAETVGFPAVLKPMRGGGSALTRRVDLPAELLAAWDEAAAFLGALDGLDRAHRLLADTESPHMILEELLTGVERGDDPRYGDYVSVESLVSDGTVRHLAVGDKLPLSPRFRENGQVHPSVLPAAEQARITDMAAAALKALGVTEGVTHTELKLTAEGPRVIEVNGRAAGGLWMTLLHSAGYDLIGEAARAALRVEPVRLPHFTGYAAMLTPCLDASLADRCTEVRLDPCFEERDGVHSVHGLHSGTFDLSLGGGHALLAYVSAADAEGIHGHERALRDAMRVVAQEQ